jgi:predicted Zn-dependent protease
LQLFAALAFNSIPCRGAATTGGETALENAGDPSVAHLAEAARLLAAGEIDAAHQLVLGLAETSANGTERDFLDGMISYAGKDYRRAETMFRRILDRDPRLIRVRLELAQRITRGRDEREHEHARQDDDRDGDQQPTEDEAGHMAP